MLTLGKQVRMFKGQKCSLELSILICSASCLLPHFSINNPVYIPLFRLTGLNITCTATLFIYLLMLGF